MLSGVDSETDVSSTFGGLDRAAAVSLARVFKADHIGYLHIVVGGVGEGGGVRDSDLVNLKCAALDRIDNFGEEDLMGAGGKGVSKSGTGSVAWATVSEMMPSLRHEPDP